MEKDGAFRIGHFLGWITNDSHRGVVPQWPDSAAVFPLLAAAENDGGEVHTHGVGPRGKQAKARVWNQSQIRSTHKKPQRATGSKPDS